MRSGRQLWWLLPTVALSWGGGGCAGDGGESCPEPTDDGGADTGGDSDTDGDSDGDVDWDTESDPYDPDPAAAAELTGGDFTDCVAGFLDEGGDAGAYAGYFETGSGAYFVWMDDWDGPSIRLRVESWPAWGGLSGPGSYTVTPFDQDYDTCAICVFVETAAGDYWLEPDGEVVFSELTVGMDGIGEPLAGTVSGTLSDGDCAGLVEFEFSGTARDLTFGPL